MVFTVLVGAEAPLSLSHSIPQAFIVLTSSSPKPMNLQLKLNRYSRSLFNLIPLENLVYHRRRTSPENVGVLAPIAERLKSPEEEIAKEKSNSGTLDPTASPQTIESKRSGRRSDVLACVDALHVRKEAIQMCSIWYQSSREASDLRLVDSPA